MPGEVEKCPILHVCPKFDVFTLSMQVKAFSKFRGNNLRHSVGVVNT